jgi:hypothetical protein
MQERNRSLGLTIPLIGLWLVAALVAASCSSSSGGGSCTTDNDCPSGQFCIGNKCTTLGGDGGDGSTGGDDGGVKPTDDGQVADDGQVTDGGGDPGIQPGQEVLRKPIGAGSEQIGCDTPEDGDPVGPMSFAVAADETIYVLDQVNARVQVYRNNSHLRSLPLPSQDAIDIDVTSSGSVLVLDNLLDKALFIIDGSSGAVLQKIDLEGKNIAYAPAVTGIFFRPSGEYAGIWAEIEDRAVLIAKVDGSADPDRISVPGLLTARGDKLVRAEIIGDITVMVYRSTEKFSEWNESSVEFDALVVHLPVLAVDLSENAYLGAFLSDDQVTKNVVVKLNASGQELKRIDLPVQQREEEVYRSMRVDGQGRIYQMIVEENDVVIRRYVP